MRLFISAGEPSGDLHGANLIQSLRELEPDVQVHGFGGERMAAAGCELVYPLTNLAMVGLWRVICAVPRFWRVLKQGEAFFQEHRPDALVLIDFPGFHWWLARAARKHGIPVIYFVAPQLWAWGGWRVHKMRRLVNRVLCTLPFEEDWYRQRQVPAQYVGHPYFDELRQCQLDGSFLHSQRSRPGEIVAILPGSRGQELHYNVPAMVRAAGLIHARRPDVRFLVACVKEPHARLVQEKLAGTELPIEVHHGMTPEIIQLAHSCMACSGSVGLELLYRGKPSVIVYQTDWTGIFLAALLKTAPHISLVNLLAGRRILPEYWGSRCYGATMANHILTWLQDRTAYESVRGELAALRDRVAEPGACRRAAAAVLDTLRQPLVTPAAA
jgi:lipid-A-disaccharide synthase